MKAFLTLALLTIPVFAQSPTPAKLSNLAPGVTQTVLVHVVQTCPANTNPGSGCSNSGSPNFLMAATGQNMYDNRGDAYTIQQHILQNQLYGPGAVYQIWETTEAGGSSTQLAEIGSATCKQSGSSLTIDSESLLMNPTQILPNLLSSSLYLASYNLPAGGLYVTTSHEVFTATTTGSDYCSDGEGGFTSFQTTTTYSLIKLVP